MYPERYDAADASRIHQEFDQRDWSEGGEVTHYAYLHLSEFFPHAIIHRAGPISGLIDAPSADLAALPVQSNLGIMTLDDYVHTAQVDGIVILHKGQVVYERYPRMRSSDLHLWMSVSKVFASTIIAMLADRGAVNTTGTVEQWIPELGDSGWAEVNVQDVLDMCSGIDCLEIDQPGAYSDPATGFYQYEASLGWLAKTEQTWESTYDYIASLGRGWAPGERYQYTSVNTFVLSWLAERITDLPYAELISDLLWRHIGAESAGLLSLSSIGAPVSHGGISATVRDIARLGLLYTPSWPAVTGKQLVSDATIETIQRHGRRHIVDTTGIGLPPGTGFVDERPRHSAYQWNWVMPDGDFYKGGFGGQGLYISPTKDLVIAYAGTPDSNFASNKLRWITRQIACSDLLSAL